MASSTERKVKDEKLSNRAIILWSKREDPKVPVVYPCCKTTKIRWQSSLSQIRHRSILQCPSCSKAGRPISKLRNGGRISGGKSGYQRLHLRAIPEEDHWLVENENLWQGRYVLEHRYVLAKKIGRPLMAHESPHHKDGNPRNNKPANLELRRLKHGRGSTDKISCPSCGYKF